MKKRTFLSIHFQKWPWCTKEIVSHPFRKFPPVENALELQNGRHPSSPLYCLNISWLKNLSIDPKEIVSPKNNLFFVLFFYYHYYFYLLRRRKNTIWVTSVGFPLRNFALIQSVASGTWFTLGWLVTSDWVGFPSHNTSHITPQDQRVRERPSDIQKQVSLFFFPPFFFLYQNPHTTWVWLGDRRASACSARARCLVTHEEKRWGAQSTAHFRIVDLEKSDRNNWGNILCPHSLLTLRPSTLRMGPKRRRSKTSEKQASGFLSTLSSKHTFLSKKRNASQRRKADNCVSSKNVFKSLTRFILDSISPSLLIQFQCFGIDISQISWFRARIAFISQSRCKVY